MPQISPPNYHLCAELLTQQASTLQLLAVLRAKSETGSDVVLGKQNKVHLKSFQRIRKRSSSHHIIISTYLFNKTQNSSGAVAAAASWFAAFRVANRVKQKRGHESEAI